MHSIMTSMNEILAGQLRKIEDEESLSDDSEDYRSRRRRLREQTDARLEILRRGLCLLPTLDPDRIEEFYRRELKKAMPHYNSPFSLLVGWDLLHMKECKQKGLKMRIYKMGSVRNVLVAESPVGRELTVEERANHLARRTMFKLNIADLPATAPVIYE